MGRWIGGGADETEGAAQTPEIGVPTHPHTDCYTHGLAFALAAR